MRFTIEQRHLTDSGGKPVARANTVTFHNCDAEDVDDAVRLFVKKHEGEILGDVLKFPGYQAVATLRTGGGVYTLQVTPASQQHGRT
ncbi:MAG TPA: hypothetical protein VLU46_15325 [Thermoanaerobaculia bacterium]|nr:hypothetical protein [Thermoanaerobaculia bacterium]